jgi:TolA-binding protein
MGWRSTIRAIVLTGGIFLIPVGGWADTIHLRSAPSIRFIKVAAFKEGRLETISSTNGQRKMIDYAEIALIRVDSQPDLNEAERLVFAKQYDRAIKEYQKAIEKAPSKNSWIVVWSQVRMMNLLACQGQIERAVEMFITLSRQIPDWVMVVTPTREGMKGTESQLNAAAENLVQARDECKSPKTRDVLGKFYQRFGRERPLPALKAINAAEMDEKNLERFDQPGPWLDSWAEEKIKTGKVEMVERVTKRLFTTALRRNLPAVFYWQGRALMTKGEDDDAALAFLEIVVEFPSSSYAAQAIFYSAKMATETGRTVYAQRLWQELIDNFSNSNDYAVIQLVEKSRDALHEKEQ